MARVAQIVYDCIPDAGSDPGIGWHAVISASNAGHQIHALSKEANRALIEAAPPVPNVTWHFIDVKDGPGPLRTGSSFGDTVHLLRWLRTAKDTLKSLIADGEIDLIHFVTFTAHWIPVPYIDLGVPHVFGPVGGGETVPPGLSVNTADTRSANVRNALQTAMTFSPVWTNLLRSASTVVISASAATTVRLTNRGVTVHETRGPGCLTDVLVERMAHVSPIRNDRTTVVASGRQLRWKGHDLAIRAIAVLVERQPDLLFEILGDGPEHQNLVELSKELGIEENIRFRTGVGRDEERQRIAGADCFVFPSRRDAGSTLLPLVQLMGVPIAAFDTPAVPEATGGFAHLAEADGPGAPHARLAEAITQALEVPRSIDSPAAERALGTYGQAAAADAISRWYQEALSRR